MINILKFLKVYENFSKHTEVQKTSIENRGRAIVLLQTHRTVTAMLNINSHISYFSHAVNHSHDEFWDFNRYQFFTNVLF